MHGSIAASAIESKQTAVQTIALGLAPDFLWVMATARAVWPTKTAEALHDVTGASLRTCKYWLSGDHVPAGRSAVALLRAMRQQLEQRVRILEGLELALDG